MSTTTEQKNDGTNGTKPQDPPIDPIAANDRHGGEIRTAQLAGADNGHAHEHGDEDVIPHDLPEPSRRMITGLIVAFVVLFGALFLIGWIPSLMREHQAAADAEQRTNDNPVVSTTQPVASATSKDVILPCDVRANQDTMLFPRVNGYLKKWNFDIQARVKKDDVLAEISAPDVDAQLNQSRASLEQSKASVVTAQSNLDLAEKTLKRYQDAQKNNPGAVTQEDLDTRIAAHDQAVSALKQAQANVGAAQADLQRMEVLQGFEKIIAPFDGVVTFRGYDVGALLSSSNTGMNQEIFRLQQTDVLRVFVSVPQSYATSIHTGQPAYLTVRNYGGREFQGTVARYAGSLDPMTRTMQFELDFPNPTGELYPGMYGQARLGVTQPKPVMTIPSSALVFNSTGTQVAVIKDGKAQFRQIVVGRDLGTQLEVVEGLSNDDMVVSNPGERLVDGVEVQVATPKGQAAPGGGGARPEKLAAKD